MIYWLTWIGVRLVAAVLLRLRYRGAENVPRRGPVLLAANHRSYLDPPLLGAGIGRRVQIIAKEELLRPRLLGWFLRQLRVIPLRRGQADRRALRETLAVLAEGGVAAIFPEGTRSPTGELLPPEVGAGMLAYRSGATVIPVYIEGTQKALPVGGRFRPARVTITYGPPVALPAPASGKPRHEDYARAAQAIMDAIARLREERAAARTAS